MQACWWGFEAELARKVVASPESVFPPNSALRKCRCWRGSPWWRSPCRTFSGRRIPFSTAKWPTRYSGITSKPNFLHLLAFIRIEVGRDRYFAAGCASHKTRPASCDFPRTLEKSSLGYVYLAFFKRDVNAFFASCQKCVFFILHVPVVVDETLCSRWRTHDTPALNTQLSFSQVA